ncbi:L-threonine ammonia-lyase [Pacificibacter maritimus]|uniref:L-threonine dehydratase n=1 Tax=Pacificibacter maritimus TaxID=762213 RepID=A0A3N4U2H8_9RHOB|nr:threonine ammonia-lyase IlvA [Pacificibacter maritimus]RPE64702.1 L-threonine ammonia-lyase [Pacificibacter maritimus]
MTDTFTQRAKDAAGLIHEIFEPTLCARNDHLSKKFDADIWLKREDLSPVRSYKIRGAVNAMHRARNDRPNLSLFVCASAGNHAQGVAFACRHFGVRGVIFMPVTTPKQKVEKTRIFGGDFIEIRMMGDYFDDTLVSAKEFCAEAKGHFLAPFDDEDVIAGQASVAVEFFAQLPSLPDIVILPVGGGGLASGVVSFLKHNSPSTEIYFVEPMGGASLTASVKAQRLVALEAVDSFVDGAAVAQIGSIPFSILKDTPADHILTSPEDRICTSMVEMLNVEGIVLEPAGALTIDALTDLAPTIRGRSVLCVVSGGNFDFERLPEVKERAQKFLELKKYFILRMPQRPGALRDFLDLLGKNDDVARFEYLKKSARNFGSVLIGIETTDRENFDVLFARMDQAGLVYKDITNDQTLSEYLL